MSDTTNFSVRMDSALKKQCEQLYGELGLNLTTAINVFLRQSLREGGFPFDVKLDKPKAPKAAEDMSKEELYAFLKEGLDDIAAGRTVPAREALDAIRDKYGL